MIPTPEAFVIIGVAALTMAISMGLWHVGVLQTLAMLALAGLVAIIFADRLMARRPRTRS